MRKTPLVGTKLWFLPRTDGLGWGWKSVSWEGHVTFGVCIALALVASLALDGSAAIVVIVAAMLVLVATAALKGTVPGGRRRAAQMGRNEG